VLDAQFAAEYPVLVEGMRRQIEEHLSRSR
jgi:hypothetical protein